MAGARPGGVGLLGASLAMAGLTLASCQFLPAGPAATAARLTAADSGKDLGINAGQELEVTLEANPTTGYDWSVAQPWDEAVLELRGSDYQSSSQTPGAGGTKRWRFAGRSAGQTTFSLAYRRPWETGVAPLRTFTLTVSVGAPRPPP